MNKTDKVALYIDPPSYHFLRNQLFNVNDGRLNGDNILAPYAQIKEFFNSNGVTVNTADYLLKTKGDGARNIYVSMGMLSNYLKLAQRKDTVLSAFFAMECPIVEPSMYESLKGAEKHFNRILSWSDSDSLVKFTGKPIQIDRFCWPQSFDDVHEELWYNIDRKFLTMINSNKLPQVYWQELYTERLRAVEFFSRTGEIDLYGVGWDGPPFRLGKTRVPNTLRRLHRTLLKHWQRIRPDPLLAVVQRCYRGQAKSKSETLGQYTFAICFENMILKGWITEKIFDCFFAGTVPIYWGA
ncbi:MAG: glycosyltransferase family 10, partial [Calditrichaeota bacterium]|nr:glycosyltransferase family 10 [Calditrichota bacterium]